MAAILGTSGNDDTLLGASGNDEIHGLAGSDTITGFEGDDIIYGNIPGGDDFLADDTVDYSRETGGQGVTIDLDAGTATDTYGDNDTLHGIASVRATNMDDTISGDEHDNIIRPLLGDDVIDGRGGTDEVHYRSGSGILSVEVHLGLNGADGSAAKTRAGGADADILRNIENIRGSAGADILVGNEQNNRIRGLEGADNIDGGDGVDAADYFRDWNSNGLNGIIANLATHSITDGFGAVDTVNNIENVYGTQFDDEITGDDGDNLFRGFDGADNLVGGDGDDTADYRSDPDGGGTAGIIADLAAGTAQDNYGKTDTLASIENILGTNQVDEIRGAAQSNFLFGGAGGDELEGRGGDDELNGGDGSDTAIYSGNFADYTISQGAGFIEIKDDRPGSPDGTDKLIGVEKLVFADKTVILGTSGIDNLQGTVADDVYIGLADDDSFFGSDGDDIFYGNVRASDGSGDGVPESDISLQNSVWYNGETGSNGVVLTLAEGNDPGTATDTYGKTDTLYNIQAVGGSNVPAGDTLTGNSQDNIFRPYAGNDIIDGKGGVDEIHYGTDIAIEGVEITLGNGSTAGMGVKKYAGAVTYTDQLTDIENIRGSRSTTGDILTGNDGANRIRGLKGADIIDGGAGVDTADYRRDGDYPGGNFGIVANLADSGDGTIKDGFGDTDTVRNIENVIGTQYVDVINGNAEANALRGIGGDDVIDGKGGEDTAQYLGLRSNYQITRQSDGSLTVRDLRNGSPDGTDTLFNIEKLFFIGGNETIDASQFQIPSGPSSPPPPPPPPPPEEVTAAIDAIIPGVSTPGLDELKEKLAQGEITFEELVDGLIQEAQSSTVPSLIMSNFLGGETPTQQHLAELTVFAQLQYDAYAEMGVANPAIGSYEALGLGYSETVAFQNQYGAAPPDLFIADAYSDVFGRAATEAQHQHFTAQLAYFQNLYDRAGFTVAESLLKAKGAIVGQMMGHAVIDEPELHGFVGAANNFLRSAVTGDANYGEPLQMI